MGKQMLISISREFGSEGHTIARKVAADLGIIRHDARRKLYHNRYSEFKWGDSRGYDLCINSSRLGVDKTVKIIEEYIKERM